ncbi:MAG: hypothetical protein FJY88_01590 [Candidatus Eisenbacteria bacterium]|nr:hypothetical protein [Candidatus Eisenbacteria bacterium]
MSSRGDLRDSLHRGMLASGRGWSSEEIARAALKIVSRAAQADRIVEGMLEGDPRFSREGSLWSALAVPKPPLASLSFVLVDAPPAVMKSEPVPLFLRLYDPGSGARGEIIKIAPDGSGLERGGGAIEERLAASLTAGAARRQLHRLERSHALRASSDRLLDLALLSRRLGLALPDARRACPDPSIEERLHACGNALERILAVAGERTLEQIEADLGSESANVAVDFSSFRFGREVLDFLPARPGVYRFYGEDGKLLYIGKSRDLSRRVSSYFCPLAPDHARRARLLAEIRDLEWETTPSELEALLIEGETIRAQRPSYNMQVEIHPSGELVPHPERDLLFVLCEGDPDEVSVFSVRDGAARGRARLPRGPAEEAERGALVLAGSWLEDAFDAASGWTPIPEPEAILVLRYLRLHGDEIDRVRASDHTSPIQAAESLARLALRERPAWDPWTLRPASDRDGERSRG